ncbi:MAG: hypothetical protein IT374_13600 [Polyangiaceae bacterium]|nr:hypothetical protein [Polyangiaceae bacterium]
MKTGALSTLCALLSITLFACSGEVTDAADGGATAESEEAATSAGRATYYRVVRQDTRKCAYPMCGGVYVARVNAATTRCADGTSQAECYVADLDLSGLGLTPAHASSISERAEAGRVVLRGSVKLQTLGGRKAPRFDATEAWEQLGSGQATGTFYKVVDRGIRCITTPCPSFEEAKLNSSSAVKLVGFDVSQAGLSEAEAAAVHAASAAGVIAAGSNVVTPAAGPAGAATDLVATAAFVRVRPVAGYCDDDSQCVMTTSTRAVSKRSQCYCRTCPDALDVDTAAENEQDYATLCASFPGPCPAVKCMAREARCVDHRCTAVAPTAN